MVLAVASSGWATRNERYLQSLEKPDLREVTERAMKAMPGLDARAAHILATYRDAESIIGLITWVVESGLAPVEFVETLAKAPNVSWRRLVAYWSGALPANASNQLAERLMPHLGEAAYACEIRAADPTADVEMQYQAGRRQIDLFVRVGTGLLLEEVECHGQAGLFEFYVAKGESLAIELTYGSPVSHHFDYAGIEAAIRTGHLHATYAAVATVSDYLYFYETEKVLFVDEVRGVGGRLLVASVTQRELLEWADRILTAGRDRHGEPG